MKKNKISKIVLVWALMALPCAAIITNNVMAEADSDLPKQSNSMTVSPPYQKMILVPGEEYSNSLSVFNSSNSTRDLKYAVKVGSFNQRKSEDGSSVDDYGRMDHVSVSSYNQIMDWITLENEGGKLAPGESADIPYTIKVPENAPGGGQYATILVIDETTSGSPGEGNISIDQSFQFASIIYAEVAGDTKEIGSILENNVPSFLVNGGFEASSMVRNDGNVHTDASYTLQVWPLFSDEEICTNEEEPDTSLILPETERYHAQSCELPSVGIFKAKQVVKIFGEESIMERTVIVCPIWLLFIILFVIAAIIIWLVMRVRQRDHGERNE